MRIVKEFRDFAMKGNVVDLAVGVIIGTAFGKIVSSLVEDIIMPMIWKVTGGVDFSNMYYNFGNPAVVGTLVEARKVGAVLAWGNFVTITLNFVIVAFCIFLVVKAMNRAMPEKKTSPPAWPTDIELLSEIRDILQNKSISK
jgi:large conductance mechanosensitive channel